MGWDGLGWDMVEWMAGDGWERGDGDGWVEWDVMDWEWAGRGCMVWNGVGRRLVEYGTNSW